MLEVGFYTTRKPTEYKVFLAAPLPFDIGKPQLRPPRCDTRVTPEEKRRFLTGRVQETEGKYAPFNAETDAEETYVWFQNYFMNSFNFSELAVSG